MKRVVLLGDSIRMGYGKVVPELLKDEYEVWQPEDNCRFSSYTLRMLFELRGEINKADIIHWNNGLWDICQIFEDGSFTSLEDYIKIMKRIATKLLAITDKVIFATTTAVDPRNPYDHNEVIDEYNAAIVPVLKEMGIQINDLNSLVKPNIGEFILPDYIHLTDAGIDACGKQVADSIRSIDK